ncbi:MAG: murein biosynthesis integral membrane protein MurJ [Propionibacteriaceae bacterium]|jgi:murein biosynthesis integral membrane protein MurJ|nr:murein biosynthesis integral membrane protein MurJ [Propionibacteriaceae bacterium]
MSETAPQSTAGAKRLINATWIMASGTLVSRILGLARAMLIAAVLGNGTMRGESFNLAMVVPNSLYILLAGGTLNNVLVPQIAKAAENDEDGGEAFINRIMTGFLLILAVVAVLLTVIAPLVMNLYAREWNVPEMAVYWQGLVLMSYITMPQIFFYGVFFLIGQVLNAKESFGPMMWAPTVNNVVSILVFGAYASIWGMADTPGAAFSNEQTLWLAFGSTIGIGVQTLVLLPFMRKAGVRFRPRFDLRHTGLGKTFHLAKWMVGFVVLTSLAQIVIANLGTYALAAAQKAGLEGGAGGFNAYNSGYLIWILPHSLLTVSLATAMLPSASRAAALGDFKEVAAETTRAIRLAVTFLVPAALGFLALSDPITRLIYSHGAGASDYHVVAYALACFAIGLVPYTIQYIYLRAFYSLDNTRTPFFLQIAISGANALLAVLFVLAWQDPTTVAARLALSYSAAYTIGLFITHKALKKRLPELSGRGLTRFLGQLLAAGLPSVALAWAVQALINSADAGHTLGELLGLAAAIAAAVLSFFLIAKAIGVPEISQLFSIVLRRKAAADIIDQDDTPTSAQDDLLHQAIGMEAVLYDQTMDEYSMVIDRRAFVHNVSGIEAEMEPTEQLLADPDGKGIFIKVSPPPDPLFYPEPTGGLGRPQPKAAPAGEPAPENTEMIPLVESTPATVSQMLVGRFRLDRKLSVRGATELWRAYDEVLDRWVLIYLLGQANRAAASFLLSARRAALATDARFLRVLDVVTAGDTHPAYVVYEYAPGVTLANVLEEGPLTGAQIAWLVRDVADAITHLHDANLTHGRLTPATVMITNTGNVKITGLLAAETSGEDAKRSLMAEDVKALGKLLYAGLFAKWIGGAAFGLEAADIDGQWADAGELETVADAAVLNVVDRILSNVPAAGASRLTTAPRVTTQLSLILGPVSAATDLRSRLHILDDSALVSTVAPPEPIPVYPDDLADNDDWVAADGGADALEDSFKDNEEFFTPVPPPAPKEKAPLVKKLQGIGQLPRVRAGLIVVIVVGVFALIDKLLP